MAPPSPSRCSLQPQPICKYQQALQDAWQSGSVQRQVPQPASPFLWVQQDSRDDRVGSLSNEAQDIRVYLTDRQRKTKKMRKSGADIHLDPAIPKIAGARERAAWTPTLEGSTPLETGCCSYGKDYEIYSKTSSPNHTFLSSDTLSYDSPPSTRTASPASTGSASSRSSPVIPHVDTINSTHRQSEENLLLVYLSVIVPTAKSLCPAWHWLTDLSRIDASPMLAAAVMAYAAAFAYRLQMVSRTLPIDASKQTKLVKFPLTTSDDNSAPRWLQLQTDAVTLLLEALGQDSASSHSTRDECVQTMIMLMRLAVLFGDDERVQMHLDGLRRMLELRQGSSFDLEVDVNLGNIDLAKAYLRQLRRRRW